MFLPTRLIPWPDDMILNDMPMGLVSPEDGGELIAEKTQPFDSVAPTEYNLNAYPLYAERTMDLRRLEGGMGLSRQRDNSPRQYNYTLFLDASLAGLIGKGPLFHLQNGAVANGAAYRDHVIGRDQGQLKEFGAFGQYVYIRNGDGTTDWALSKDFGAGRIVNQLARFKSSGASAIDAVYAVTNDGQLWQYDGTPATGWHQCALPVGPPAFQPTAIETTDDDLFGFGWNELRSCSADPLVAASWSGTVVLTGDAGVRATWLRALHGRLYAFKETGVYTVSGVGGTLKVNDLMPEVREQRSLANGVGAAVGRDALWFPIGDQLYKLTTGGDVGGIDEIATVGLGVLMENESEVRGRHVGMTCHGFWFGYFLVVNGTNSYLCKWGSWLNPNEQDPTKYQFSEVPHGAIYKWTGKVATGLFTTSVMGSGTNQRLIVGFADGTTEHCLLPFGSPSPYAPGSGCEFTTTDGRIYYPRINVDWPADDKIWRCITPFTRRLDSQNQLFYYYLLEDDPDYLPMPQELVAPAERVFFPEGTAGREISSYLELRSVDTHATPLVEGIGLHYSVLPDMVLEYAGAVDARHYRVRRDGTSDLRDPRRVRDQMVHAFTSTRPSRVTFPDGLQRRLFFHRYTATLPSKWRRYGDENLIPFKAIDFRLRGTEQGSHAHLMKFIHKELMQFDHSELQEL